MKQGFFQVKTIDECLRLLQGFTPCSGQEEVFLHKALHRISAQEMLSPEDLPAASRSSMDGYALRARDVFGASESNPAYLSLRGRLAVHEQAKWQLQAYECAEILTGGTLPPGADAVVMFEHTRVIAEGEIEILRSISPGENIMLQGEDCRQGQAVIPEGKRLRAQDLGLLAALGMEGAQVRPKPKVALVSTGDELVPVHASPSPGLIRDVNSSTLRALCLQAGADILHLGIVRDDAHELRQVVDQGLEEADCLILSGGSSVGSRDLSIEILSSLDQGRILTHGVAMSPGKPTIIAEQAGRPILGLPGQVTSAQMVMHVLGMPLIRHLSGDRQAFCSEYRPMVRARLGRNIPSAQGREDFVRVTLTKTGQERIADPVFAKSGLLRSLLQADGVIRIPLGSEGCVAGEMHDVWLI